jgi:CheY-like chemotaxis protein
MWLLMTASSPASLILVVDDHRDLLDAVTFALSTQTRYTVETAEDGVEGLEKAIALQPACIVIDVKMPGLNGNQLVRVLRGDPATAAIPLIILSALVQPHDQWEGLASGADQYLTKPLDRQELISAIERAIQLSEQERLAFQQRLADGEHDSTA